VRLARHADIDALISKRVDCRLHRRPISAKRYPMLDDRDGPYPLPEEDPYGER